MSDEATKNNARQLLSMTGWEVTFSAEQSPLIAVLLEVLLETSPVEVTMHPVTRCIKIRRKNNPYKGTSIGADSPEKEWTIP